MALFKLIKQMSVESSFAITQTSFIDTTSSHLIHLIQYESFSIKQAAFVNCYDIQDTGEWLCAFDPSPHAITIFDHVCYHRCLSQCAYLESYTNDNCVARDVTLSISKYEGNCQFDNFLVMCGTVDIQRFNASRICYSEGRTASGSYAPGLYFGGGADSTGHCKFAAFRKNSADHGIVMLGDHTGTNTLESANFVGNTARSTEKGLFRNLRGTGNLEKCVFRGNSMLFFTVSAGSLTVSGCSFDGQPTVGANVNVFDSVELSLVSFQALAIDRCILVARTASVIQHGKTISLTIVLSLCC